MPCQQFWTEGSRGFPRVVFNFLMDSRLWQGLIVERGGGGEIYFCETEERLLLLFLVK
jgi:hypothetical protein